MDPEAGVATGLARLAEWRAAPRRWLPGYEPAHDLRAGLRETLAWYAGRR